MIPGVAMLVASVRGRLIGRIEESVLRVLRDTDLERALSDAFEAALTYAVGRQSDTRGTDASFILDALREPTSNLGEVSAAPAAGGTLTDAIAAYVRGFLGPFEERFPAPDGHGTYSALEGWGLDASTLRRDVTEAFVDRIRKGAATVEALRPLADVLGDESETAALAAVLADTAALRATVDKLVAGLGSLTGDPGGLSALADSLQTVLREQQAAGDREVVSEVLAAFRRVHEAYVASVINYRELLAEGEVTPRHPVFAAIRADTLANMASIAELRSLARACAEKYPSRKGFFDSIDTYLDAALEDVASLGTQIGARTFAPLWQRSIDERRQPGVVMESTFPWNRPENLKGPFPEDRQRALMRSVNVQRTWMNDTLIEIVTDDGDPEAKRARTIAACDAMVEWLFAKQGHVIAASV